MGELLDLHCNDYKENATNAFKSCYQDQDFTDVTLATADDKQIKAHKIILSSCSQFFKNILLKNSHSNPLIYLKDMKFVHIKNVMELIYLGVCYVGQDTGGSARILENWKGITSGRNDGRGTFNLQHTTRTNE